MKCHHVRAFVDGCPTPAFGRPNPGDVRRHLEDCPDCRNAREALNWLERELCQLPSPDPPRSISEAIVQRIAEENEENRRKAVPDEPREGHLRLVNVLCGMSMLAGVGIGTGTGVYQMLTSEPFERLLDAVIGTLELPDPGQVNLVLGTGVVLYLAGLAGWMQSGAADPEGPGELRGEDMTGFGRRHGQQ